jgi:preprotein translocase subunit SecB
MRISMTDATQNKQDPHLPMMVHAQYIKDLSFENPNAPASLRPNADAKGGPSMDVNVNMNATKLPDDNMQEVVLTVEAKATRDDKLLFIAELQYAVVCSISPNVPEQHVHPLLMIEAPKMAFPFARQILCDAVIGGGFPPMMLNPVDFEGLYLAQYKKEQDASAPKDAAVN